MFIYLLSYFGNSQWEIRVSCSSLSFCSYSVPYVQFSLDQVTEAIFMTHQCPMHVLSLLGQVSLHSHFIDTFQMMSIKFKAFIFFQAQSVLIRLKACFAGVWDWRVAEAASAPYFDLTVVFCFFFPTEGSPRRKGTSRWQGKLKCSSIWSNTCCHNM